MQLGKLSFCDRIGNNIRDADTKSAVLEEVKRLTSPDITDRAWSTWVATNRLPKDICCLCTRSNGNPYLMCILNMHGTNRVIFIDRKVNKAGTYILPRMILTHVFFSSDMFAGTVLDGELVRSGVNRWVFLINGCICLRGSRMRTIDERISGAQTVLASRCPSYSDPCEFQLKRWFPASAEGVDMLTEFAETLPYTNRGIYAFTSRSWTPWLFNYDNSLVKTKVRVAKNDEMFRADVPTSMTSSAPPHVSATSVSAGGSDAAKIRIESTDTPDLFVCEDGSELDVPNMATSLFLSSMFAQCPVGTTREIACSRNSVSARWVPIVVH